MRPAQQLAHEDHCFYVYLNEQLGEGAVGLVLRCEDRTGARLAAKRVLKSRQDCAEQLRNQIMALSKLDYPCIIRILPYQFETQKQLFMIMEYCENTLFDMVLRGPGPLSEPRLSCLFHDLALALAVLAANDLVHQDIKTENIYFKDGYFKLSDFGTAVDEYCSVPIDAERSGTLIYSAPETVTADYLSYSIKSDVYSAGVALYISATGKHPYLNLEQADSFLDQSGPEIYLAQLKKNKPADLLTLPLSPRLKPVLQMVKRMISLDPRQRPSPYDLSCFIANNKWLEEERAPPATVQPWPSQQRRVMFTSKCKVTKIENDYTSPQFRLALQLVGSALKVVQFVKEFIYSDLNYSIGAHSNYARLKLFIAYRYLHYLNLLTTPGLAGSEFSEDIVLKLRHRRDGRPLMQAVLEGKEWLNSVVQQTQLQVSTATNIDSLEKEVRLHLQTHAQILKEHENQRLRLVFLIRLGMLLRMERGGWRERAAWINEAEAGEHSDIFELITRVCEQCQELGLSQPVVQIVV